MRFSSTDATQRPSCETNYHPFELRWTIRLFLNPSTDTRLIFPRSAAWTFIPLICKKKTRSLQSYASSTVFLVTCNHLCQEPGQRTLDIQTAKAMLGVLLSGRWPLLEKFQIYLEVSSAVSATCTKKIVTDIATCDDHCGACGYVLPAWHGISMSFRFVSWQGVFVGSSRAWKNVNFPGSLSKFPVGRKLKTIALLWRRKRNLFSWKRCTQEP